MKKALALLLALVMLCSTAVTLVSATDPITIDMLDVYESVGYEALYAGEAINNGPTLDGKIEEGEYTASRTIKKEDLFNSSDEVQSDITEYFAHNENFVFYAIQFVQEQDNRALMPNFKVSNTFDIYKDATNLGDYFRYRIAATQFRHGASEFYYTAPTTSHDSGQTAPVFRDDIVANSGKDANNVKTYEIRFSKAYFANLLGVEMSDLRVIPYYFYFHSACAVATLYTDDIVNALTEKLDGVEGSWIPPVGEGAFYFMVLDDTVNTEDEWEVFHNDLGWNVYVGDALTSKQQLDGKIGDGEYTASRVLENDGKFLSAGMESNVTEYLAHDADFMYYAVEYKETADYRTCNIRFRYSNSFEYQYAGAHLYQNGVAGTWFSDDIEVYPRLNGSGLLVDTNSLANGCTGVGGDSPTVAYIQKDGTWTTADGATPAPYGADLAMSATLDTETRVKIYEYRFDKAYFTRGNSRTSNKHIIGSPNMVDFKYFTSQIYFHGNWSGLFVTDEYKAAIKAAGGDDALASKYGGPLPLFYVLDEEPFDLKELYDENGYRSTYVGAALSTEDAKPVQDGVINENEYQAMYFVSKDGSKDVMRRGAKTTLRNDYKEYIAHDAEWIYFAAEFDNVTTDTRGRFYWNLFFLENFEYEYNGGSTANGAFVQNGKGIKNGWLYGGEVKANIAEGYSERSNSVTSGTAPVVGTDVYVGVGKEDLGESEWTGWYNSHQVYEFKVSKAWYAAQAGLASAEEVVNLAWITMGQQINHGGSAYTQIGHVPSADVLAALAANGAEYKANGENADLNDDKVLPRLFILDDAPEGYYEVDTQVTASARVSSTNPGLRFKTKVDKDYLDNLVATYGEANVKVGTLIAPTDKLIGDLTIDTNTKVDVAAIIDMPFAQTEDTYTFAGSITNIKPQNLTRDFTAVGYVAYSADGQNWTYVYSVSEGTRNVTEIAQAALDAGEFAGNETAIGILKDLGAVAAE